MMNYEKQVKMFKKIIPIGLKPVPELIEILKKKVDVQEINFGDLPGHRIESVTYNASHCICNDELKLEPEDMIFHAFEVIRNEKSVPYLKDYPRGSVYTIFEERTVYICSDSNKLFRELEFARGISKDEYEKEGMQFRCLVSHLAMAYDEEHNIVNVLKNFSKNLFLKVRKR